MSFNGDENKNLAVYTQKIVNTPFCNGTYSKLRNLTDIETKATYFYWYWKT